MSNPAHETVIDAFLHARGKALTKGLWSTNCGSEIFAMVSDEEVRIGHFMGCADDSEAICALRNASLSPDEIRRAVAAATPGWWSATEDSDIVAMVEGIEVRIGYFQGCVSDAEAVCALKNQAKAVIAAIAQVT